MTNETKVTIPMPPIQAVAMRQNCMPSGKASMLLRMEAPVVVKPESHLHLLPETAKDRIKPIVNPVPQRTIGLVFRKDYVHERMMNIVVKAIKTMVPSEFLDGVIRTDYLRL